MTEEIQRRETIAVAGALTVEAVVSRVAMVQQIMKTVMKEDVHYGVIPGCNKPSLLKPGAETLGMAFQLRPEYEIEVTNLPNNHKEYVIKCSLYSIETGNLVGSGVGSCSTMEAKYRYRQETRKCPECGVEAIIKGKESYGGGWLCWKKKEGCGAKFKDGDKTIEGQVVGRIENPDLADINNTVLKMGKKRAHIDATLTATAASDIFTQDIEDLPAHMINRKPVNAEAVVIETVVQDNDMPWSEDSTPLKDLELWMKGHYHDRQTEALDMLEKAFGTRKWSEVKELPAERIEAGLKQMKLWIDGEPAEEPKKGPLKDTVETLLKKGNLIDAGAAEGEQRKGDSRGKQPFAKVVRLSPEEEKALLRYQDAKNVSAGGLTKCIRACFYPTDDDPCDIMRAVREYKNDPEHKKDIRYGAELLAEWYRKTRGVTDENI